MEWTNANWWGFLLTLVQQRHAFHEAPLRVLWCPAHLLEHVYISDLTDELAVKAGSTMQDMILNRLADQRAKEHIRELAKSKSIKVDLDLNKLYILGRQLW